ncbi:MAG: hypothetical protein WBL06_04090 [Pseudolysinimonas sp.]|uniref:hypothetical protein n=1 Tax=Pseudolysinimonas sp. TaxID=2680009 RepID=UPI003C77599E
MARALLDALLAPQALSASDLTAAEQVLQLEFAETAWGIRFDENPFAAESKAGLFKNEISGAFKRWLADAGVGLDQYVAAIPDMQYQSVEIWPRLLFPDKYRSNEGWRIRIVGYPALSLIAFGLCHSYAGSQSQKNVSKVSALLRSAALNVLDADADAVDIAAQYLSATAEHWDRRLLMTDIHNAVGTLDVSGFADDKGDGAELRMARNTTVKKELSSFFFIRGASTRPTDDDSVVPLGELHRLARGLLGSTA